MPFLELSGKNIRNLKDYHFVPSTKNNIISGKNGAGKTNLLEGIYINALGRSFRTSTTRSLINDNAGAEQCLVFAKYQDKHQDVYRLGVERRKGTQQSLSINGKHYNSLIELAKLAPTLAIQPNETQLIDGPSQIRRKHLDWVLFHVEPSFLETWRQNQKLLKQRNLLLRGYNKQNARRGSGDLLEIKAWDQGYIESCEKLSKLRNSISIDIAEISKGIMESLPALNKERSLGINFSFHNGWPEKKLLRDALEESLATDLKRGFSGLGSHRSDLVIKTDNWPAKERLSRGQKKLLAITLCLAQARLLKTQRKEKTVLLLDDVFSELDEENARAVIEQVEELETQVFVSCLHTQQSIKELFVRETKVFHVEQGQLSTLE